MDPKCFTRFIGEDLVIPGSRVSKHTLALMCALPKMFKNVFTASLSLCLLVLCAALVCNADRTAACF